MLYALIFAGSSAVQGVILWIHIETAEHHFGVTVDEPRPGRVSAQAHAHADGVAHLHPEVERPAPGGGREDFASGTAQHSERSHVAATARAQPEGSAGVAEQSEAETGTRSSSSHFSNQPHAHGDVVHTHAPDEGSESVSGADSLSKFYVATRSFHLDDPGLRLILSGLDEIVPRSPSPRVVTPPPQSVLPRG